MKKIFTLIWVSACLFFPARAQSPMEKANQLYASGEYNQAVSMYEQLLLEGKESVELYFNLGNAYYKAGNINHAILNYERAQLLAPNDEDIKFNLKIANQYVVDKIEPLPRPFFVRWRDSVINSHSADVWGRFSIISFVVTLALAGLFFFTKSPRIKQISFLVGILTLLGSAFTYSFGAKQKAKLANRKQAIVFCPRVTVKSSPSGSGTDLFLIHEGLKVEITDSLSNWKEIKLLDGNKGWLRDSCIVKI